MSVKQSRNQPPRYARAILKSLLGFEEKHRLGDYEEIFLEMMEREGRKKACRWYWCHTLRSLPDLVINLIYRSSAMLKSYFKIAFRNMNQHKGFAVINIMGLAIGIAGAMLILLWVQDEKGYDTFHANADRIYRVTQTFDYDGRHSAFLDTQAILAPTLMKECPDVEMATRIKDFQDGTLVKVGDVSFNESSHGVADGMFFKFFSFELVKGDRETALSTPRKVVLSESAVKKYFGTSDPMGKTLTIYDVDYVVEGVYRDMPHNTHFHLDILISLKSFDRYLKAEWGINPFKTYVLLREGGGVEVLKKSLKNIVKYHMFDSVERYDDQLAKGNTTVLGVQKLTDIHLDSHLPKEFEANGNRTYVLYFTIVGWFILLIAVVNYMNLSTARSSRRAQEVGIRKTVGSSRQSLVRQFLLESVLTTMMALFVSIAFFYLLLPFYRHLVGKPWLHMPFLQEPLIIPGLILAGVVIGILAGIYPAFVLSSFSPISVLRGKGGSQSNGSLLRNCLVVFQFSISIILLIGTFVVQKQMTFVQHRDLGFDREEVVVIDTFGELGKKVSVFKEKLKKNPSIIGVSASTTVPGRDMYNLGVDLENENKWHATNVAGVDEDYFDVMKMKAAEGRLFSKQRGADREAILINESLVRSFGRKDLVGKRFSLWTGRRLGYRTYRAIGVVRDFHYDSLLNSIKPMVFITIPGSCEWEESYVSVRIRSENIHETISFIKKTWENIVPGAGFQYSFMDSIYDGLYQNELRTGQVFIVFTFFALFVACLGLLGLSSFTTQQKMKEIGIRKVFGATVRNIVFKLSGEFTRLVIVANIIAWPIAFYTMNQWLNNFAYRMEMGPLEFFLPAIIALVLALLTVSLQSFNAAVANPVDSIK